FSFRCAVAWGEPRVACRPPCFVRDLVGVEPDLIVLERALAHLVDSAARLLFVLLPGESERDGEDRARKRWESLHREIRRRKYEPCSAEVFLFEAQPERALEVADGPRKVPQPEQRQFGGSHHGYIVHGWTHGTLAA